MPRRAVALALVLLAAAGARAAGPARVSTIPVCDAAHPCPGGGFCELPSGACARGAPEIGVCVEQPDACAEVYDPVCGCDGETYANECERRAAGVSKERSGTCEAEPPPAELLEARAAHPPGAAR